MEGVYYYETEDGLSLLKFYENGTVIKAFVTSGSEKIPDILKWLSPNQKNISKGNYTKRGKFINFELSRSVNEVVICTGTFSDDKLNLFTHSHVNDFRAERIYSLFKPEHFNKISN